MASLDFVLQQIGFEDKPKNLSNIELPLVLKDRSLMPPGTYNGYYLSSKVIRVGFDASDWNLKEIRSLYAGHPSDPVPTEWVGEIQNAYFDDEIGGIKGDIIVVDQSSAIKLAYGAKFGVSPSIDAVSNNHVVERFTFRNFGLVIQPAMVRNYLNNALKKEDKMEENQESQMLDAMKGLKSDMDNMKSDISNIKMGLESMEPTDQEMLEMAKGGFAEFYKKFREKYPDATMQDAAKAYKKQGGDAPEKNPKDEEEKIDSDKKKSFEDEKEPEKTEDKEEEKDEKEPEKEDEKEKSEETKEGETGKVEGAQAPKFSSFLKKLQNKDPKVTKTQAKKLYKAKYPKAKVNFEDEKPDEGETKPDTSISDRIASIESKINEPVRNSEIPGAGKTKVEDVDTVFFQWIESISK